MDHQITAFKADRFHLDVYLDGETLVGFIGYWDFDDYLYIEHYAINSDLRGGGWGSRILEALQKTAGKTIILEIDEVVDEISTRRVAVLSTTRLCRQSLHPPAAPLPRHRDRTSKRPVGHHDLIRERSTRRPTNGSTVTWAK
ncbi:MAG: GNAT family N-acetyltransferase [Alistipes indistinctus]